MKRLASIVVSMRYRRQALFIYYGVSLLLLLFVQGITAHCADYNLPPLKPFSRFWINIILVNLIFAYSLICLTIKEKDFKPIWALFFIAIGVFLCATPPGFGGDMMEYLMRGRILSIYGKNPYLYTSSSFPGDLLYPYSVWRFTPETYGPLFVAIEALPGKIFSRSIFGMIFSFKLMVFGFLILGIYFFQKICRTKELEIPEGLSYLFFLNPLILIRSLVDGHNDILMVSLTICAVYFFIERKYTRALLLWSAAFAVKFIVIILLPVLFLMMFKEKAQRGLVKAFIFCVGQAAVILASLCILFLPFWAGTKTFEVVLAASKWFHTNTIPYAAYQIFQFFKWPITTDQVAAGFKWFFIFCYALMMLFLAKRPALKPKELFRILFWVHIIFTISLTSPIGAHYMQWGQPWLFLSFWPHAFLANLLYTSVGIFAYFKRINYLAILAAVVYVVWFAKSRIPRNSKR